MAWFKDSLKCLADIQRKYALTVLILTIFLTFFLAYGLTKINIESDMSKEMPKDLPVFKLKDKVSDKFGGADMILVVFTLDSSINIRDAPTDIRDPRVISSIIELENRLKKESSIDEIYSLGSIFQTIGVPETLTEIKQVLGQVSGSAQFISNDYTTTLMYATATLGLDENKIRDVTDVVNNHIEHLSKPAGLKITITGVPPIRNTLLEYLVKDIKYTILIAGIIIFIILIILEKSLSKAVLIFSPVALGLIWTIGTMGWINLSLSIATVGIGAMILGLGVEYGIFLLHRYKDERESGKTQQESLQITVSSIGSAIIGSGATTIIGFSSLMLASMPMLQHLGATLTLGIFCSLSSAVLAGPSMIILEENFQVWYDHNNHKKIKKKIAHHEKKAK
ncbi:MAG: MMPL family transporter [Nanoarchaeota archaeon]|nr:MMPL family transporter [Nanoarchaeota archaeon]